MKRNNKRKPGFVLGFAAITLLLAAWLLFPIAVSPEGRLVFELLWVGFCTLPAFCYYRLMRESARRKAIVQTEEQARARLVAILEATPDLVAINDIDGKICYLNQAGRKMLGMEDAPSIPTNAELASLPGVDASDVADDLFPIGLEEGSFSSEKILDLGPDRKISVSQVVIAHKGDDGKLNFLSTIARDITERKQLEAQMQQQLATIREQKEALEQQKEILEQQQVELVRRQTELERHQVELERHQAELEAANAQIAQSYTELKELNRTLEALATTDGLTGLLNHRAFQQKLTEEFERSGRYHKPLSLMLVDVDKFKQFNDTYGHPAGDQVLKQVASVLQNAARATDWVARYGGEEFVLILPETNEVGALEAAERIRAAIEQAEWPNRAVTISVGVASMRLNTEGPAMLIAEADQALYVSKEFGRNRVTHHGALMDALLQG